MVNRGSGTIIATSATAAMRGNKNQHSHAAAMGARRLFCQTLNDEFASQGIHVAHVIVDGMVDAPDTLGKILGPELFEELRTKKGKSNAVKYFVLKNAIERDIYKFGICFTRTKFNED